MTDRSSATDVVEMGLHAAESAALEDGAIPGYSLMAEGALSALKAAGYAVVLLPEPDSERYEGDEHEPEDRPSWQVDMYEVAVWTPGEVQINYDGTEGEPLDLAVARDFGGALLAAVERADQQYRGGEGQ